MKRLTLLLAILFPASAAVMAAEEEEAANFHFDVFLDGSPIGVHEFRISEPEPGRKVVRSNADFDVKFLFLTAFEYDHENTERWSDGCLSEISASTNSNGKRTRVQGQRDESAFIVESDDGAERLPECVMTFAYWNPDFLQQDRLLNPQTGEYIDVEVEPVGKRTLEIDGQQVSATGYRVEAPQKTVTVWYSTGERLWLALEAPAKGGRTLRYERG